MSNHPWWECQNKEPIYLAIVALALAIALTLSSHRPPTPAGTNAPVEAQITAGK